MGLGREGEYGEAKRMTQKRMDDTEDVRTAIEIGGGGKARKEPEEKACLFASDKPDHRTVFSTFCRPQLPSAFSMQVENLRDHLSPNTLRFSMWQLPAPDSPDQSQTIPRDFNMNCLLIATRPRGTLRRYFGLSV